MNQPSFSLIHTQQSVIRLETLQDEDVSSPSGPDFSSISEIEPTSSSSAVSDPGKDDNSSDKNSITSGQGSVESGKVSEESSTVLVEEVQAIAPSSEWDGFKIVGDNIDKNVRPSYQRHDHQMKSFHHFHSYAVRDRIDLTCSSNISKPPSSVNPGDLLTSVEEWDQFKDNCCV